MSSSTSRDLKKTLSLRVQARQITFERPSGSALSVNNGSTVIYEAGTLKAVISSSKLSPTIKLIPNASLGEIPKQTVRPIEMRVLDRTIFLDRAVELFVVQDITGRSVMTVLNTHKIVLGDLRSGIYIVRVEDKGATHTSKFILR